MQVSEKSAQNGDLAKNIHIINWIFLFVLPAIDVRVPTFTFFSRYADNMEDLLKSLALKHMPANMQDIDRKKSGV